MKIESVRLVYFSPTGTTQKIVEGIARGITQDSVEHFDITKQENRRRRLETSADELLVVGVPVYFGRVQETAMEWLKTLKGRNTPTVCVVVYGNRAYDDALLELKETVTRNGCIPIACGAYIGEHSFSCSEAPIAPGRPDSADLSHAEAFGEGIRNKLESIADIGRAPEIQVPGRHPYVDMTEGKRNLAGVDLVAVNDDCTQCGECAQICPVGAIDPQDSALVDKGKCIVCQACIKHCPVHARRIKSDMIKGIALRLSGALQSRKEPVSFM